VQRPENERTNIIQPLPNSRRRDNLTNENAAQRIQIDNSSANMLQNSGAYLSDFSGSEEEEDYSEDESDMLTLTPGDWDIFMPIIIFEGKNAKFKPQPGDLCSICIEGMAGPKPVRKIRVCKHLFHSSCITDWIKVNESCPNCKASLKKEDMIEKLRRTPRKKIGQDSNLTSNSQIRLMRSNQSLINSQNTHNFGQGNPFIPEPRPFSLLSTEIPMRSSRNTNNVPNYSAQIIQSQNQQLNNTDYDGIDVSLDQE